MYGDFSELYDILMDDFDYRSYAEKLASFLKYSENILEIGCGTGRVTEEISGLLDSRISAFDISLDMLSIAYNRSIGKNVQFFQADMVEFRSENKFDGAFSGLDCLNYILEKKDLDKAFSNIRYSLEKGSPYILDMNTVYNLKVIHGDLHYINEKDGIYYGWVNQIYEEERRVDFFLDFFIPEGDLYRRVSEEQTEAYYELYEIEELLNKNSFEIREVLDGESFGQIKDKSLRYLIRAEAV